MIRLSSIHIYPCKGLAGISVPQVEIDDFGPKHDRRWMLVDENNDFLTQRQQPQMVLIRPEIRGNTLVLEAPGQPPLEMPLIPESGTEVDVCIFGRKCSAWETFLTSHLNTKLC